MSFQQAPTTGSKANPDILYYNAVIVNNTVNTFQTAPDPAIVFQDTRQSPSIRDTSQYTVAVQNFTLNGATKNLPIFIPQISPAATTRTITSVVVTSQYITYTASAVTNLAVGLLVGRMTGLVPTTLNFSTPQAVVACPTSSSFSIANSSGLAPAVYGGLAGTAVYQNPLDINTTIYSVTLSIFDGTNYWSDETFVQWEPENIATFTEIPLTALPTQNETDYYYCYSYTHWVVLLNKALRLSYDALVVASGGSFGTQCPYFEFDPSTGLFTLSEDSKTSICPAGVTLPVPYNVSYTAVLPYKAGEYSFVGMNTNMEGLMANLDTPYFGATKRWKGALANPRLPEFVFNFGLTNLDNAAATTGDNAVGSSLRTKNGPTTFALQNPFTLADQAATFVQMTQDYISTGSLWSPCSSFVLATSQIPIRTEDNAPPITLGSSNTGGGPVRAAFQKVLLEVPINAVTADIWRGFVLYEPLVPTFSSLDPVHDGLTQLDVSVYWRNRLTNSLIPLRLYNEGTMSFRLMFRRKGVSS